MKDCIFCKIANKEIPTEIIWEDENFLAFLDVDQTFKGHTLVIPKKHFRWVWDVEEYDKYFKRAREIKNMLDKKYHPAFTELKVYGTDVPHAHIHLIPHF